MYQDMEDTQVLAALEALLFVSNEPLTEKQLAQILEASPFEVRGFLEELQLRMNEEGRGVRLMNVAGGWRLFTDPAYHDLVERCVLSWDPRKLSRAAVETLAIVAYLQPVTRNGVASVRGVNSDSTLSTLLERGLIREAGVADTPGNPTLYATTRTFLEHFGLGSVSDLPPIEDFAPDEEAKNFIRLRLAGQGELAGAATGDLAADALPGAAEALAGAAEALMGESGALDSAAPDFEAPAANEAAASDSPEHAGEACGAVVPAGQPSAAGRGLRSEGDALPQRSDAESGILSKRHDFEDDPFAGLTLSSDDESIEPAGAAGAAQANAVLDLLAQSVGAVEKVDLDALFEEE